MDPKNSKQCNDYNDAYTHELNELQNQTKRKSLRGNFRSMILLYALNLLFSQRASLNIFLRISRLRVVFVRFRNSLFRNEACSALILHHPHPLFCFYFSQFL